jgi:hypothetical protein
MSLDEQRRSRLAASTAEGACAGRAADALQRDPSVRGPDYMAGRFIAPGLKLATLSKLPGVRRLLPRVMTA